jgi:hypothetical protein
MGMNKNKYYVDLPNFVTIPENSEWKCYMFGNKPGINVGYIYLPRKGCEPNWFVRWMMKICFDCTWVKDKNT